MIADGVRVARGFARVLWVRWLVVVVWTVCSRREILEKGDEEVMVLLDEEDGASCKRTEHDTVRPLFAIDRFGHGLFSFVRWVGWEMSIGAYSAWNSAASSLVFFLLLGCW
jgi:hypothetical protein